ncbi:hypothetical protein [Pseudobacteriovorax antillogorgiicola]|uniref:GpW protein n=1 Tax=Pseudobacteriovorax antillogorgiicola TaxID=1513793 RepID=A0A1Y6CNX3_9BACT|nr:hypothetical protein [Pseudobacteriovorax antillogorgiicola]TCS44252.1 hypothetical protein EDD56_13452 [Pseudobacteriovorax antillogorgiicola]SMF80753.1 hypothetical protein SAMN06296036_13553 [Pseudobacteriovorax antillogorgiicola]
MKSYREQLEAVEKAIEAAEKNQEFEIEVGGNRRRHKKANLADLYKRETFLRRMVAREGGRDIILGVPE